MNWFRFFFGTPQRFMRTFVVVGLVAVLLQPGLLAMALQRFLMELSPLVEPAVVALLVYAGFKMIIGGK